MWDMRTGFMTRLIFGCFLAVPGFGQNAVTEQPAGVVLSAGDAQLLREGMELSLLAKSGDLLFSGDTLTSGQEPSTLLDCAGRAKVTLAPGSNLRLEGGPLRPKPGRITETSPTPACSLPSMARAPAASGQHLGASLTRALRPQQGKTGTPESRMAQLPEDRRTALLAELPAAADDPATRLARAGIFEKYQLNADAAEEYQALSERWPDAAWLRSRLFVLEDEQTVKPAGTAAGAAGSGRTYALLIGISRYQSEQIRALRYANEDAIVFRDYLRSARGGALPASDVILLTDEKATTAAIRNAFDTFLKARAGPADTVIVFLAGHGTAEPGRGSYLVTYDSDPQDLVSTALPMAEVQKLLSEDLSHVGRVMAYVDACRSGTIGTIPNQAAGVNANLERLGETKGEMLLFTASRAKEVSYEGPQYGGGHGAFTYFLLNALNGEAVKDHDGRVSLNEVIDYVRSKVAEGTYGRQHPRDLGTLETDINVADTKQEGIHLLPWSGPPPRGQAGPAVAPVEVASRGIGDDRAPSGPTPAAPNAFEQALAAGRLLPDEPNNAFDALQQLRTALDAEDFLEQQNRLRVALEDRGQQVLLRYLSGDQHPQTRADFASGAAYFQAARLLTPESLLLDSRASFCLGREALFDKAYAKGAALLERAARIDPSGGYSYNALGIAYLEQANYTRALAAFRDAMRLAPYWAYPLHNAALAETELGDYQAAIRYYRQAMKLAPQASYLPYNLGLVYERINQRKQAETAFRAAAALSSGLSEPLNALGALEASLGRNADAERLYRQALDKNPTFLAARHNLAVLLATTGRVPEALDLWRANLAQAPDYLPSRLSLARALAAASQTTAAVEQFQAILNLKPDYVAARLALADVQAKAGEIDLALAQLREALRQQPGNPLLYEQIGDLEASRQRASEARTAYQAALDRATDSSVRDRIRKKLRRR